jgi:hypothetical protein
VLAGERAAVEKLLQAGGVERGVDHLVQAGAHRGVVAVAHGLDQQVAQGLLAKRHAAQHVEHLAVQGAALLAQLGEQARVHVALAGVLGHEVPQVAHLGLADAVDAAEALLEAVGVPRQVVVHHEVGALQVHALARRVGGHEHAGLGVLAEAVLGEAALVAAHGAADGHHRAPAAQKRRDLAHQVVQGVAVLGEHDELEAAARGVAQQGVVLQDAAELVPLAVGAARAHLGGAVLEAGERLDLGAQLVGGGGGRGGVEHVVLGRGGVAGGPVVLVEVVGGPAAGCGRLRAQQAGVRGRGCARRRRRARGELGLRLGQALGQPLAAAPERAVDGLGRARQAALQRGEGEAHAAAALAVQGVGAVELAGHVLGHRVVEALLGRRELVAHGVGAPLGEQRRAVEAQQLLLHEAAHGAPHVDGLAVAAHGALELVLVHERHEQLEVLGLAVVRGGREQQDVGRERAQQPPQPEAPGGVRALGAHGGAHLVGLVAHHEVPGGLAQQGLRLVAAGELVEPGDGQVGLGEGVARGRGLEQVVGHDGEGEPELLEKLVLPLLHEAARAHDEAAPEVAAGQHLLDEQARHDRFAGAGVVGQHVAQRDAREHLLVHGADLVRQRLHVRGVHGQVGVEEVREAHAARLAGQGEVLGRGPEGAGGGALDLEVLQVLLVHDALLQRAVARAEHHGGGKVALAAHAHHGHALRAGQARDRGALLYVVERGHGCARCSPTDYRHRSSSPLWSICDQNSP